MTERMPLHTGGGTAWIIFSVCHSQGRMLLVLLLVLALLVLLTTRPRRPPRDRRCELRRARRAAIRHLKTVAEMHPGGIVVFDFDDTLVTSVVTDVAHVGPRTWWHADRRRMPIYGAVYEMIDVAQVARRLGLRVYIITARRDSDSTRAVVDANCRRRGVAYDAILAAQPADRPEFKARLRARLAADVAPVVLTVGDRWNDVREPGRAAWIKLPDAHDDAVHSSLALD